MKKSLWILLALLLVLVAAAAWAIPHLNGGQPAAPAESAAPETAAAEAAPFRHIDVEKLRKAYDRDAVYARIGEREISWGEYYDWLGVDIVGLESYMSSYASLGYEAGWESVASGGDSLAAQTVSELNDTLRFHTALERLAAANGAEIGEDELDARVAEYRREAVGENGSDDDWNAWLGGNFLSEGLFRSNIRYVMIYERLIENLYGNDGEKLSAARLQHFIEDQELLRFRYLFFLTVDPATGAPLEQAETEAVRTRAEEAAETLLSAETREDRLARFDELASALQEEDGARFFADEYVTAPGALPDLYLNAVRPLKDYEYELSGLVSDDYGIYLFLRMPVEAGSVLADGTSVGAQAALAAVSELIQEEMEACPFVCAEGAEPLDLLDYLAE